MQGCILRAAAVRRANKFSRRIKSLWQRPSLSMAIPLRRMSHTHFPMLRLFTPSLRPLPWRKLPMNGRAQGRKNLFGQKVRIARNAVRGRRSRRSARLPCGRRTDNHIHRFSGSSADDPQHVQNLRRNASRRFPCYGTRTRSSFAFHLRRSQRRYGLHARPVLQCSLPLPCRKLWILRS